MRILIAGDTHNNITHARYLFEQAQLLEIQTIIQLGDWGFTWPRAGNLSALDDLLCATDMTMLFCDGNHDNYSDLKQRGIWRANQLSPMTDRITYIPRGVTFEFDGISFMGLGGAVSIDRDHRIPGASWWQEESITERDIAKCFETEYVDVLLTHDAPFGAKKIEETAKKYQYKYDDASIMNRKAVRTVMEHLRPLRLYHGHWHLRHSETLQYHGSSTQVEGLDCDGTGAESWAVLDTTDADF